MTYDFSQIKNKIQKTKQWLGEEYLAIHTGRANPSVLDKIQIEQFGTKQSIQHVASIGTEDARTLLVTPWDKSITKDIEKAIMVSGLGLSTSTTDAGIRVSFPELTGERREMLIRLIKSKQEDARIAIRKERESEWDNIQSMHKKGELTEDDRFRLKNDLQKICSSQVELWDKKISSEAIAFYAALDSVAKVNPLIAEAILQELNNQRTYLKLIASENYSSLAVQLAMGNLMTDKYAEGIAGGRFYAGCDNVDNIENEGIKLVKELFGVEHAYIQPHSGADANLVAFTAIIAARVQSAFLKKLEVKDVRKLSEKDWMDLRKECGNQKMLALGITSGGHLTHGYRMNISALLFEAHHYEVSKESGILNYDQIRQQAQELKPLILLALFV